jgi:hypothetical protein
MQRFGLVVLALLSPILAATAAVQAQNTMPTGGRQPWQHRVNPLALVSAILLLAKGLDC